MRLGCHGLTMGVLLPGVGLERLRDSVESGPKILLASFFLLGNSFKPLVESQLEPQQKPPGPAVGSEGGIEAWAPPGCGCSSFPRGSLHPGPGLWMDPGSVFCHYTLLATQCRGLWLWGVVPHLRA